MKKLNKYIVLVLSVFIFVGCETLPEQSKTTVEWKAHQERLKNMDQFVAKGKIGLIAPNNRISASFDWQYTPDNNQLRLINVLGQTMLTLTTSENGSSVVTSEDEVYQHKSANVLFYRLTKIEFPVEQMQDWIKGLPTKADSFTLNDTHTLSTLNKKIGNQQWRMSYSRYQDIDGVPLPYQMTLKNIDTTLKVIVSEWEVK